MSLTVGVAGSRTSTRDASWSRRTTRIFVIIIAVGAVLLSTAALLATRHWPFSESEVREDLAEATDSTVIIRGYHPTYFPPGCTLEGIEFRHREQKFKLITIEKLVIEGSYSGILTRHIPRITAIGTRVYVPPTGGAEFHSQHSKLVVDELVANGTEVEFVSASRNEPSLVFDVHEALLSAVRWGSPIQYRLKFHNPNPPGEIAVEGKFGAWTDGHPQDTPLSGAYNFDHADLGVYEGIGGILSSKGQFEGVLKHVNVSGTTDTPDFVVHSGGHKHELSTQFDAYVDATNGDTFLNHVEARLDRTGILARGSIAKSPGKAGKAADLYFTSHHGRIEDILGLFVSAPRSPMSGDVSLSGHALLASTGQSFLESVKLDGRFGIDEGKFKPDTQKDVNELSAGARGKNKEDPETVLTDLKGAVALGQGVADFSDLDFGVPGANARLHGTYNILNHRINLHGDMKVDKKISNTTEGMKALLLKIMDPFFRKKTKGEIVPVHILGTYEKPQFGLDLAGNGQHGK